MRLDVFDPLAPFPNLFLHHENHCRSEWAIPDDSPSILFYHKRGTVGSDSTLQTPTVTTSLASSPIDAKTPTRFFDADPSMMGDAPMMDLPYPRTAQFSDDSRLQTVRRPLPVFPRHGIRRLSDSDTASGELVAIPLHYRSHPFTKEEISYPGGPQFSGSDDSDVKVPLRYTDESAIISWLDEQDYGIDTPPNSAILYPGSGTG